MRIIRKLQPLFLILALVFIVLLLRSQWAELSSHTWRFRPAWLLASALFLLGAWALEIQIWRTLLHVVGGRLPYWPAARIWFLSAIVRYVPGNIWQPLSITLLSQQRGVSPVATLTSVAFYQILVLLSALPIAGVYFGLTGNWGLLTGALQAWTPLLAAAALVPVAVFLVHPAVLVDVVNWVLVRLKRTPLATAISRRMALWVLLLAMADWLLWGLSFAMLTFALEDYSAVEMLRLLPHLIAVYAIAYTIGLVSLITPSGLGVREGAFYLLLAPLLGGGTVTIAALAMRVWTTLGELIAAGVSLLWRDRPAPALGGAAVADTGSAIAGSDALAADTPADAPVPDASGGAA